MAGDVSPAQWWRGVRNQRGKNCCRAWSRAGPCALWDSYPPPVSPFTLGATDNPPPAPTSSPVRLISGYSGGEPKPSTGLWQGHRRDLTPKMCAPRVPSVETGRWGGGRFAIRSSPCFSPGLTLQGQSGSDRTGATHTWPRAAWILTPARPKQLS